MLPRAALASLQCHTLTRAVPKPFGDLLHGVFVAFGRDEVVAGDVGVTGIQAYVDGGASVEEVDEVGDLVEGAAHGEFGAGGVFDEDAEWKIWVRSGAGEAVDGALDVFGGVLEGFGAGEALPGAGVQDEEVGTEGEGAFDFAAEGHGGVVADGLRLGAEIDEVGGVDGERGDVVLGAEGAHLFGVFGGDGGGAPGAGRGREDLEAVGTAIDGALDGGPSAAGGGEVDADALVGRCCHGLMVLEGVGCRGLISSRFGAKGISCATAGLSASVAKSAASG